MQLDDILNMSVDELNTVIPHLSEAEQRTLALMLEDHVDQSNPYLKYHGDIERIIGEEWGEVLWSKQREILKSFKENQRTCVVTTPGIGKSDLVSMIICALIAANVHEPTQIRVITTAANFRLVKTIMWPYIKRVARDHKIPGYASKFTASRIGATEWYVNDVLVADGVASADNDETSMRGIHSLGKVVVIVDEASGISHTIGRVLNGLLTTPEDRLIVLGNPPTDETDTWFEWLSNQDIVSTIHIPYDQTPNFTGEVTGICRRCGPRKAAHTISEHLTSRKSIADVRAQYPDENDPYVQAFLFARFPTGNTAKAIPMQFLQKALPVRGPKLRDDGSTVLDGFGNVVYEPDADWVRRSESNRGMITLGVDVASDGGDEMVIAKKDGWHGSIVYHQSGPENENAVPVAGHVLREIKAAIKVHEERDIRQPVVCNIDRNGVGWAVASLVTAWAREQKLNVQVNGVMVGEKAVQAQRFTKKRSEIWWNMRELLQGEDVEVTLDVDELAVKQLNGPTYTTGTDGRTQVETKDQMKRRTAGKSPDRADALLLAYYAGPSKHSYTPGRLPVLSKANEAHIGF